MNRAEHTEVPADDAASLSATRRRVALHTCCGPCLLEPYDALAAEGYEPVVVFYNPNIHPVDEYEHRRASLREYAAETGLNLVELDYDPESWLVEVGVHGADAEERCRACYRQRLRTLARWAADNGVDAIATTLTVSPYQDPAAIAEEGQRAAAEAGVDYLDRDYRDRFAEAAARSRELGMYRQNYCGCLMSEVEVRRRRARREKPST